MKFCILSGTKQLYLFNWESFGNFKVTLDFSWDFPVAGTYIHSPSRFKGTVEDKNNDDF